MTCSDVAIEAIAGGELTPSVATAEHLSACAVCTAAIEEARLVDSFLRGRPAPLAPAQFTSRTMNRIRRASWRREQIVDGIFNAAMIATALLAAVGLWIAVQRTGLSFVSREALGIFSLGLTALAQKVSASLPLYAGATGLLVAALGLWWWAERDSLI
jgi:anti-sigma factor RsiW